MLRKAVSIFSLIRPTLLVLVALTFLTGPVFAQSPVRDRITQEVIPGVTAALPGTVDPRAKPTSDLGRVDPSTRLAGMTMYFQPSAAQQAALNRLLQQQQTPGSPLYHKWITPAQYASQFGLSANDLAKIQQWLEQQGFSIDSVSNSHNAITFSGSVAQVEAAFQTQIHHYNVNGVTHTANAAPLSIPSAFAGIVLSVRNVSDFRPHPLHRLRSAIGPQFTFNSGSGQFHFLAPGDFAALYDLNPLYSAGFTGSGVTIVIVGQSAITTTDITDFQSAANLTQKAPTTTLVPNSGTSTLSDQNGDEDESDLDIEWSGAIARGATINFVYVGNNQSFSAFDSIQYAIDNNLGSIISSSYGACESDFPSADITTLQSWFQQASAQGQTVVAAAGDNGATDCETASSIMNGDQATRGLAVDLPAASPYVTGIGGSEFFADVNNASTYWNLSNATGDTSALGYIPEKVWNDTSTTNGLEAGGGGKSTLFGKPSWQSGIGVPNDGARDVPDISLAASANHDGYLLCATGSDADPTSCSKGFLDSNGEPDVAGGTSFGAPTFSGILAILSQKLGTKGLGNVNPEIYSLAASDYAAAFHDITTGNNDSPCASGSTGCTSSPIGYSATTGYDLASGWGSIDAANFVNVFNGGTSSTATTTTLTASNNAPLVNTAITLTATVTSDSGATTPAGSVQFVVDGSNAGSAVTLSSSGVATNSYTPTTAGSHTIVANFTPSNAAASSASSGTLTITVSSSTGSFTLSATNVTVAQGSSGTSTVTLTPSGGFAGSVSLSVSAPSSLTNACFTYVNPIVGSNGAVTNGTVTVNTSDSACTSAGSLRDSKIVAKPGARGGFTIARVASGTALASLLLIGLPGLRRRRWPALVAILFVASLSLAVSGCGTGGSGKTANTSSSSGSSSEGTTSTTAPKGTYTLTLTGTDTALNEAATTTFTLTVD